MRQLASAQSAATALQAHWRGHTARQATKRIRAVIALQRVARGMAVRRQVARQRGAAVAIQSAWRQRQAMRRYAQDVWDITHAQVHSPNGLLC
jgi:myosin heavy subunit